MSDIVEHFIDATREEDQGLASALGSLDDAGKKQLAGVLHRFDQGKNGNLGASERLFARRVLLKLHRPDTEVLTQTNQILDYLDLNADATLDKNEIALAVEVLEMFCKVDSDNDTLNLRELELLYAVLRNLDADDSQKLERPERDKLRAALENPKAFWEREKESNPRVKELLAG